MTKTEFIEQLRNELSGLPQVEIDDIIRDQEEVIRDALLAGRSEESIIASLGQASELAKNLKAEIKIEKAQDEKKLPAKVKALIGAAGAVLVLAPFNLLFVLGPLLALFGILFGGWAATIAITVTFFILTVGFLFFSIILPGSMIGWLGLSFGFLGGMFFGLAVFGLMYLITMFVAQLVLKYLLWNVNFVKRQAGAVVGN
jgi:uncharacterized membrane protein